MSSEKVQSLFENLKRDHPLMRIEFKEFPSGGAMLDVYGPNGTYVLEYYPSVGPGFGISRMDTATYGFEGYENYFEHIADAERFFRDVIAKKSD